MRKKDILELKRRLKKDDCTFTKMCGCYVNGEKNILLKFNETFLNLEEDEFFKYLEIAKKSLSGTIGNNLLELEFPFKEEEEGGRQYSLMQLKKSGLKNEALLDEFYNNIINNYDYTGNFLILLFHDAYDIITKTTDNSKLDESEEVYEYILCAICPVSLSKPGLSYHADDNRIGARTRDWVVESPTNSFIFPAFIERSSDIHSVIYYTKNPKDTHPELMEGTLGCASKQTAAEQKEVFTNIIRNAVGSDDEKSENIFMEIQDTLNTLVDDHNTVNGDDADPILLTDNTISDLLIESGVPEEISVKIEKSYLDEFGDTPPLADNLIDSKTLAKNEQKKREKRLEKQVKMLENKLEITKQTFKSDVENSDTAEFINSSNLNDESSMSESESLNNESESSLKILKDDSETNLESINQNSHIASENESLLENENTDEDLNSDSSYVKNSDAHLEAASDLENSSSSDYDIVLQVKPEKLDQIKYQIIEGKKYLVIPVDDTDQANVNGINKLI